MKLHPLFLAPVILPACGTPEQPAIAQEPVAVPYELAQNWPQLPDSLVLGDPTGVGLDHAGHLWVFCRGARAWTEPMPEAPIANNTVLMLDAATGQLIASWGAGRFIMPHGLTVDQHDRIWLTDVGLHQVFCFTSEGQLLLQMGEARVAGNDSAHFNMPTDVAVASDGSFYVSDGYGNSRVVKYDSTGCYLFEWGTHGADKGQFNTPHAIDLDSAGNVYVADRGNRRVQEFDATGRFLHLWTDSTMADLYAVTIDHERDAPVAVDWLKRDAVILSSDIWLLDSAGHISDHWGRSDGRVDTPCRYHDLCVDEEGSIYVGDILGDRLHKWVRKPGATTPVKAGR